MGVNKFSIKNMKNHTSRRRLKFILTLFNVIFWFAGLGVLGLGIWLYITIDNFRAALEYAHFVPPAFLLMISGGCVVIFGITGCIAIFTENMCLLNFEWFCITLVLAAEVAACVEAFLLNSEVESHINYRLNVTLVYRYRQDPSDTSALDELQQNFACCGVLNASDWYQTWYNQQSQNQGLQPYPESCCQDTQNCSLHISTGPPLIYTQGCFEVILARMRQILSLVGWTTLGFASVLIIMSYLVCCFRVTVRT